MLFFDQQFCFVMYFFRCPACCPAVLLRHVFFTDVFRREEKIFDSDKKTIYNISACVVAGVRLGIRPRQKVIFSAETDSVVKQKGRLRQQDSGYRGCSVFPAF